MPDRFANGDPSNDTAGLVGDVLVHGFEPTNKAYHHGGDLIGLRERLPYLHGLGIGALWLTPPFTNRFVQGDGTIAGSSSSYHGYWQIDWDQIDPHLGTEADMQALIGRRARPRHRRVLRHRRQPHRRRDHVRRGLHRLPIADGPPLRDAAGTEFDPARVRRHRRLPGARRRRPRSRTRRRSVPRPTRRSKSPAWLDDVTLYHNRGDSSFTGESDTFGDFFGLDDLFTEHPRRRRGDDRDVRRDHRALRHRRLPRRHDEARRHRVLAALRAGDPRARSGARQARLLHVRRGVQHRSDPAVELHQRRRAGDARLHPERRAAAVRERRRWVDVLAAASTRTTGSPMPTTTRRCR